MLPALLVLVFSGFFNDLVWTSEVSESLFYVSLLAIVGTAMAKVLFNRLVQISSPVFSSSVTYLITVVAVAWGMWDGERLSLYQLFSVVIIFAGVYLVNKKPKKELLRPAKTVT
jgi:drug/metabolite transporter (DMT)-like permease